MKFKNNDDSKYFVRFMRATEQKIKESTRKDFITYLKADAIVTETDFICIDDKSVECTIYVIREEESTMEKEFIVTEDNRVFYYRTLNAIHELIDEPIENEKEKSLIYIRVINNNTGYIVRSELVATSESLTEVIKRYVDKDYTVIASVDNIDYCLYIKGEFHKFTAQNYTSIVLFIDFLNDVLNGFYDNVRDAYHIYYGKVMTHFQFIDNTCHVDYTALLNCLDNIWETRYYHRFIKEVQ